jgi:hypothetical protein
MQSARAVAEEDSIHLHLSNPFWPSVEGDRDLEPRQV